MKYFLAFVLFLGVGPVRADPFVEAMQNVRQGQYSDAAAGFHALAESGDAFAAHNLAILFALGHGVPQSRGEAAYWALTALLAGLDQAAQLSDVLLAEMTSDERAILASRLEAQLSPAAWQGDGASMLALAVVLAVVRPEPDLLTAYGWQSTAAALDVSGAARAREITWSMMPPAFRHDAQAQAWSAFSTWCAAQDDPRPVSCALISANVDGAGRMGDARGP